MIEIFNNDIKSILSHINDEENEQIYQLIKFKTERIIYFIEFKIFEDLVNQYCFNIYESKSIERIIPKDRLYLFRKLFLEKMDFSVKRSILWYGHGSFNSEAGLYLSLFYHIFIQKFCYQSNIEEIFKQALVEWKKAFENNRMPSTIYMVLSDAVFEDDRETFRIAEDIELVNIPIYRSLTGTSRSHLSLNFHIFYSILLKLTTSQSFDHNYYGAFHEEVQSMELYKGEYQEILNKIRYFMLSYYLNGYRMMRKGIEIFTPWWIPENSKEFKSSDISYKNKNLELEDLNQLKDLYKKIVKCELFQDKELELVLFNFNELHKKTLISELILYDFIILESIFTKGSKSEVTFRLSLNLSLFISESKEEFKKIFQILKKLYGIRSGIIHGENWTNGLRKNNFPAKLGLDNNVKDEILVRSIHEQLITYINKAIRKIIQLKLYKIENNESSEIMKDFRDLYFLLNSKIFQSK